MKNNFKLKFIQDLIHSNYGLGVKAEQIEGELDDNFNQEIEELSQETENLVSEIEKWQM